MKPNIFRLISWVVIVALLLVISSTYSGIAYAQTTEHCGNLTGNQTWGAGGNVHVVTCDVTVPAGVTLTIEAGTIVKFQNDRDIYVNGKLVARGTSGNPIYFTSYYDDSIGGNTDGTATAPLVGNWGHIQFNGGSDPASIITRAVIRYSGSDVGTGINDGAIYLNHGSPQLSNITFEHNYINGVELAGGTWSNDVWDNTTMVYVLEEADLTVAAANTLTINPGMQIKLGNDRDINVNGKLMVPGTQANPVYFSSVFDDALCGKGAAGENICDTHNDGTATAPLVGNWGHIQFNSNSDPASIITRAVIRYSGSDVGTGINDGAIRLNNASPTISYTRLVTNYRGIEALDGSTPTLDCNDIYDNDSFGIYNDDPTTPVVIAKNHWWGSPAGPTPGVDVSGGVDYNPPASIPCTTSPTPPTLSTISGKITDQNNNPVSGVTISNGAGDTTATDSNGIFTFDDLEASTYTLTPSQQGYTFSPASQTVTVPPSQTNVNFERIEPKYSISGRIADDKDAPIAGVTVTAGSSGSATTDSQGLYNITDLPAGTYSLTPAKSNYNFDPSSRTVTVPPEQTAQNFVGSPDDIPRSTIMSILPMTTAVSIGDSFPVTVAITEVTNLGAFEFDLAYDPALLAIQDITLREFPGSSGRAFNVAGKTIDNTNGLASFGAFSQGSTLPGPNGSGPLAEVVFTAKQDGAALVDLNNTQVTDIAAQLISHATVDGSVYIYICLGDFDGDGDVDIIDLQKIAFRWGAKPVDTLYDPIYDLDKDGDIDIVDVQMVAFRWGTRCDAVIVDQPQQEAPADQTDSLQAVTLAIEPSDLNVTIDQTFIVDVVVAEVTDLGAFEFTLAYNPDAMAVVDVTLGDFPASTGRNAVSLDPVIDSQQGSIAFGAYSLGAQPLGPSGTGMLAKITFKADTVGSSVLEFTQAQITDRAGDPQTITQTLGGQVEISGRTNPPPDKIIYLPLVIR